MNEVPQIAVITANRRMQRYVTRALVLAGYEIHFADFDKRRLEVQLEAPRDLYLIDGCGDAEPIRTFLERLRSEKPESLSRVVVLAKRLATPLLVDLFTCVPVDHFIGRHAGMSPNQDIIDETELIVTCKKLFANDYFGLEKYLSSWGVLIHEVSIGSTDEKIQAVGQLENFLNRIDCASAIAPAVGLVAAELLMNAIFSAPRQLDGRPKYAPLDRANPLALEEQERCTFSWGCDGRNLGIAVRDSFGSLTRREIVRYLGPSFAGAPGEMEFKEGGAGLGLYMCFNSVTQFIFNISAGRCTEAIALFYIRSGARAFRGSARSLNLFFSMEKPE